MLDRLRSRLAWKLFFSYLAVISLGIVVLLLTSRAVLPTALQRHMGGMTGIAGMEGMMGGMGAADTQGVFLDNVQGAFNDAIGIAGVVAVVAAVIASALIAGRIVAPVRRLTDASRRIAAGHFDARVPIAPTGSADSQGELGRLAQQFNNMASRLEQTESRRTELIANVAHELRTPLTTIRGSLEGLMDGVLPAEPKTYHRIAKEADRLQRLVTDLQELSRVEGGAIELELDSFELGPVLREACDHLQAQFEDKGVSLELGLPSDTLNVRADHDRIMQVLFNLLGNALQYTPEGGLVVLEARLAGSDAKVTVTDTGIGIEPDKLPLVFDRFFRVDSSRARTIGGSGLGLTIAKYLVEAHGGRIWAESDGLGKGSSFHFTLPI